MSSRGTSTQVASHRTTTPRPSGRMLVGDRFRNGRCP
ncbi:hypothetical protein GQ607_002222 [Colletotrichum asianum]|uniref:Uncharacterized protein n=1 Tax=Colletotrichum asianum TaxID=702518 RepID=A0A8H3WLP2_9PEZI|nr:hypothetical protein GQ607_002222 [Colletotrichum asianum]